MEAQLRASTSTSVAPRLSEQQEQYPIYTTTAGEQADTVSARPMILAADGVSDGEQQLGVDDSDREINVDILATHTFQEDGESQIGYFGTISTNSPWFENSFT